MVVEDLEELAPIVVFAYKRRQHLEKCVKSLQWNQEAALSRLIIYSDGPKGEEDVGDVQEVRDFIHGLSGFKNVELKLSDINKGLSRSVLEGISEQFQHHDRLIILEDDIVVSNCFLRYMNSSLVKYNTCKQVASIHGYTYPIKGLPSSFFLRGADCWGWATWKRVWDEFEMDGNILLNRIKSNGLRLRFNLYGSFNYTRMLENQVLGKNDSWAVRWHASNFLAEKYTLYQGKSLVRNIGIDGSGVNFDKTDLSFDTVLEQDFFQSDSFVVRESEYARNLFVLFFYKRKFKKLLMIIKECFR